MIQIELSDPQFHDLIYTDNFFKLIDLINSIIRTINELNQIECNINLKTIKIIRKQLISLVFYTKRFKTNDE